MKRILVSVMVLAFATSAFAQKVTGQFKTSKAVIKPKSVVAIPVRSVRNPLKWETAVILSEGTMDVSQAFEGLDPRMALLNQEGMKDKNYITFWIHNTGAVGMNATFSEGMVQYLDSTKDPEGGGMTAESLEALFSENSPNRIAGRIRTIKPVKSMMGETYELDVNFDTPISRPPAGEKLTADGGQPGDAFMAFLAAVKSKNWNQLQVTASSRVLESAYAETPAEKAASVIDSVSFLLPKGNPKILGGEQFADKATLEVKGQMSEEGGDALYLVRMLKEEGSWRFDACYMGGLL
ncbi:hypothetical protein L0244_04090 [bacterium]|nr:hypothetical protein [bacterium]